MAPGIGPGPPARSDAPAKTKRRALGLEVRMAVALDAPADDVHEEVGGVVVGRTREAEGFEVRQRLTSGPCLRYGLKKLWPSSGHGP